MKLPSIVAHRRWRPGRGYATILRDNRVQRIVAQLRGKNTRSESKEATARPTRVRQANEVGNDTRPPDQRARHGRRLPEARKRAGRRLPGRCRLPPELRVYAEEKGDWETVDKAVKTYGNDQEFREYQEARRSGSRRGSTGKLIEQKKDKSLVGLIERHIAALRRAGSIAAGDDATTLRDNRVQQRTVSQLGRRGRAVPRGLCPGTTRSTQPRNYSSRSRMRPPTGGDGKPHHLQEAMESPRRTAPPSTGGDGKGGRPFFFLFCRFPVSVAVVPVFYSGRPVFYSVPFLRRGAGENTGRLHLRRVFCI